MLADAPQAHIEGNEISLMILTYKQLIAVSHAFPQTSQAL